MKPLNSAILGIEPSATLAISSSAKDMVKAGADVCSFAAGEPDFDTPDFIKEAAIKALREGHTKYTPVAGLPELTRAVAAKLKRDNNIDCAANQVVVSCGGKHSLALALQTLLNPGDEVVIPSPFWLSYPEMVRVAGGTPRFIATTWRDNFKITPEQLEATINERTAAFIINSPSNPTGMVYSGDELRALADICVRNNVAIISDEIYEKMVYGDVPHVSVASLSPEIAANTITVNGFSKAYSMTGWRLGYTAGPLPFIKAMTALQSHCASAPNTFAQFGALAAIEQGEPSIRQMTAAFAERNRRICDLFDAIPGIHCPRPTGAFYIFPNISEFGLDSLAFARELLDKHHVAVVPGIAFGNDNCVRLSYACSMDEIEKGLGRIAAFCADLKKN